MHWQHPVLDSSLIKHTWNEKSKLSPQACFIKDGTKLCRTVSAGQNHLKWLQNPSRTKWFVLSLCPYSTIWNCWVSLSKCTSWFITLQCALSTSFVIAKRVDIFPWVNACRDYVSWVVCRKDTEKSRHDLELRSVLWSNLLTECSGRQDARTQLGNESAGATPLSHATVN